MTVEMASNQGFLCPRCRQVVSDDAVFCHRCALPLGRNQGRHKCLIFRVNYSGQLFCHCCWFVQFDSLLGKQHVSYNNSRPSRQMLDIIVTRNLLEYTC